MLQVRVGFMAYALTLVPRGLLPRGLSKGGVRYVSQMSAAFPPHATPFFVHLWTRVSFLGMRVPLGTQLVS